MGRTVRSFSGDLLERNRSIRILDGVGYRVVSALLQHCSCSISEIFLHRLVFPFTISRLSFVSATMFSMYSTSTNRPSSSMWCTDIGSQDVVIIMCGRNYYLPYPRVAPSIIVGITICIFSQSRVARDPTWHGSTPPLSPSLSPDGTLVAGNSWLQFFPRLGTDMATGCATDPLVPCRRTKVDPSLT